jgi:mRNA-degrading endonuclease YafQ of YafQ-DinJ toxin-antitoxin module
MHLYEILAPTRHLVVSARFRESFNTYRQHFPKIAEILKRFVEFRLTHNPNEPFTAKDYPFNNYLRGYRHFHMVHGRVVLIYQVDQSELRLYIVMDHNYNTSHGKEVLLNYLNSTQEFLPFTVQKHKVLASATIQEIRNLLFEFAADDRDALAHAMRYDLSELFEFIRMIIDEPWSDQEKDQATIEAFGGKDKFVAMLQQVLHQTRPNA